MDFQFSLHEIRGRRPAGRLQAVWDFQFSLHEIPPLARGQPSSSGCVSFNSLFMRFREEGLLQELGRRDRAFQFSLHEILDYVVLFSTHMDDLSILSSGDSESLYRGAFDGPLHLICLLPHPNIAYRGVTWRERGGLLRAM